LARGVHQVLDFLVQIGLGVGVVLLLLVGQLQGRLHVVLGEGGEAVHLHQDLVEALGLVLGEDVGDGLGHVVVKLGGQVAHLGAVHGLAGGGDVVLVLVGNLSDLVLLVVGELQLVLDALVGQQRGGGGGAAAPALREGRGGRQGEQTDGQ